MDPSAELTLYEHPEHIFPTLNAATSLVSPRAQNHVKSKVPARAPADLQFFVF
jgi:hypothetical protein